MLQRPACGPRAGSRRAEGTASIQGRLSARCRQRTTSLFSGDYLSPCQLHVSCPAVEQDTEAPSTSGRGVLGDVQIHSLFGGDAAAAAAALNGDVLQLPDQGPDEFSQRLRSASSTLPQLTEFVLAERGAFRPRDTTQALHRLACVHRAAARRAPPPAHANGHAHANGYAAAAAEAGAGAPPAASDAGAAHRGAAAPALAALCDLILKQIEELDSWAVSLALWSLGLLEHRDDALLAALCRRGASVMRTFNPTDCASALVGWARLRVRTRSQREFVDVLLGHSLDSLSLAPGDWRPQELANAAWALGRVGAAGPHRRALLDTLMDVVQWRLEDFNMQELTTLVYAYARMHYRMPSALVRISNKASRHLDLLSPQDASLMMWGFAKLAFKPAPLLLDRLPLAVAGRLDDFKPQELCNLLYGYGVLRHHHPLLMDAAAASALRRLPSFSTQDVVLTIWAMGAVRHAPADPAFLQQACALLLSRRRRLLPMQVAMVLKAFAKMGFQPPASLMAELGALALEKLPAFKPVELCHLMWAYARLGYRDVRLVESVVSHVVGLLHASQAPLPKITVDTIVWAAQQVGFWPQLLIDTAEMRGVYVKAAYRRGGGRGGGGGAGAEEQRAWEEEEEGEEEEGEQQQQEEGGGGSSGWAAAAAAAPDGGGAAEALGSSDAGDDSTAVQAAAAAPRRPPPVALSLHQWHQQAQVARHQSRQQAHQQSGGGPPGAPGAWHPSRKARQLLESDDYGDDVIPDPPQPDVESIGKSR